MSCTDVQDHVFSTPAAHELESPHTGSRPQRVQQDKGPTKGELWHGAEEVVCRQGRWQGRAARSLVSSVKTHTV